MVTAAFSGSSNFDYVSEAIATFTITQATNCWKDATSGDMLSEWNDDYSFSDIEYSDVLSAKSMSSKFGVVSTKLYYDASMNREVDGWEQADLEPGTYYVKVFVDENANYTGLNHTYQFSVDKKPILIDWNNSSLDYDGDSVSNSLVVDEDSRDSFDRLLNNGLGYTIQADHDYDFNENTLIMSAVEEGEYIIIFTLDEISSGRYTFAEDDNDVNTVSISWYITSNDLNNFWTTIPHIDSWTYGETPGEPTGEARYNSEEIQFTYRKVGESSTPTTTRPSEPGTYEMVATVPDGTIHASDGSGVSYDAITHTVEFTISKISVSIPENEAFPRDGQSHQPYVANDYYTVEGDISALEIGNYDVILSLKDPEHCMWSDGTVSDKTLFWRIVPTGDLVEEYFSVDTTPETYNGSAFEKAVVCKNSDLKLGEDYEISYESNLAAGTGYVIITGLNEFEGSELKFPFQINKARPVLDFVNNGFEKSDDSEAFTLNPYTSGLSDGDIRWTSSDPSVAEVDPLTGEVTVKAIGQVTITATFGGDVNREQVSDSYDLNIEDGQTEVYVDRVVYIRVPVTDPDDPDDPADDKPEEPAIVYKNDNTLYIILLLVLAVVCVCFAAYIMYTHRKQENQGGGQR